MCTFNPDFEIGLPDEVYSPIFKYKNIPLMEKIEILACLKRRLILEIVQDNFACIHAGLKYKLFENLDKS